jgi:hypothetical protein
MHPRFHIPPLADKPQNPIMDGLKFIERDHPTMLPPELAVMVEDLTLGVIPKSSDDSLWVAAAKRGGATRVRFV